MHGQDMLASRAAFCSAVSSGVLAVVWMLLQAAAGSAMAAGPDTCAAATLHAAINGSVVLRKAHNT